eukprot:2823471-Amphidinium_carterae.7
MEAHARASEGLAALTGTLPSSTMGGQAFMLEPAEVYVAAPCRHVCLKSCGLISRCAPKKNE